MSIRGSSRWNTHEAEEAPLILFQLMLQAFSAWRESPDQQFSTSEYWWDRILPWFRVSAHLAFPPFTVFGEGFLEE